MTLIYLLHLGRGFTNNSLKAIRNSLYAIDESRALSNDMLFLYFS
ncbi:MAG: hypothetical protein ACI4TW_04780 [Prevotella sp.]